MSINTESGQGDKEHLLENKSLNLMNTIAEKVQQVNCFFTQGAITFLTMEYVYLGIFLVVFSIFIVLIDGFRFYTVTAFVAGALTSVVSGFIGMWIATRANVRVAYEAYRYGRKGQNEKKFSEAFNVAFKGGCVMGFCLVALALFNLTILIMIFNGKKFSISLLEFIHFL